MKLVQGTNEGKLLMCIANVVKSPLLTKVVHEVFKDNMGGWTKSCVDLENLVFWEDGNELGGGNICEK